MRFEFGKNWLDYSLQIDEQKIEEATRRLEKLLNGEGLKGKSFLDIGSGSGIHSVAALRLGAQSVIAIDVDKTSVVTTKNVLEKFCKGFNFCVLEKNVLDIDTQKLGTFDVVYSWGVLHHTGDMKLALLQSVQLVRPGGVFAVALYGKTTFCSLWKKIKRWYVLKNSKTQKFARGIYIFLFGLYLLLRAKLITTHIKNYHKKRGMSFYHDVHDWMGGYPYESITPAELYALLSPHQFELIHSKIGKRSGLFGSGCDEYVFKKSE